MRIEVDLKNATFDVHRTARHLQSNPKLSECFRKHPIAVKGR
jgi:hypothetical protein